MLDDILLSFAAIGAVTVVRWGFKIYGFFAGDREGNSGRMGHWLSGSKE